MKKKIIYSIILIIFLAIGYFSYKFYLINHYKVDKKYINELFSEAFKDSNEIINIKNEKNEGKTSSFENLIYPELDDDFVLEESLGRRNELEKFDMYISKNDEDIKVVFKVGVSTLNYYDIFTENNVTGYNVNLLKFNKKKLFDKYNIHDSIDLLKYIIKHYDDKVNIFSSADEIKMNYAVKMYTLLTLPFTKNIFIEGDYKGFILEIKKDDYYEIHLFNDNQNYILTFVNYNDEKYFTFDNIKDFISKIEFK